MLEWNRDLVPGLPEDFAMDKENLLMFGLTACALGISIYILWGPKLGRRSQCPLVALQNLGLTCFLNSLLQSLASCPSFFEWLQERRNCGSIFESLYEVLKILCFEREPEHDDEVYSPDLLNRQLRSKAWRSPQEQDPHELFLHILSTLEEEEQRSTPERAESLLDALGGEEDDEQATPRVTSHGDVPIVKRVMKTKIEKQVLTPSPFRGYLASQLSCLTCGSKSAVVYDKFDTLTLALPSDGLSFRLQRLLNDFVSAELIDGFSCDHCNKGREPTDPPILSQASKAIKIGKLPKCLCLHISRTYMSNSGFMYKRDNYVDFPEFLVMSQYTHNSSMLKERKILPSVSSRLYGSKPIKTESTESESSKYKSFESLNGSETGLSSPEEFSSPVDPKTPPMSSSDAKNNNNNNNVTRRVFSASSSILSGPVYRINAVVEHRGTIDSGHFVTYRRGPLKSQIRHRSSDLLDQSESRWFFTSDETVKESSLCDALHANAYMLFYEKCLNESSPVAHNNL